jgi:hypothetical protein
MQLNNAWATERVFDYSPLTIVDFSALRHAFLEDLDLTTVETKCRSAKWSKRTARFEMFSDDYASHHTTFHIEDCSFSYEEFVTNPFISYVMRDDLSHFLNTDKLVSHIRTAGNAATTLKESLLLTGSKYQLPFHIDGCETILIAIRGIRKVSIMANFAEQLLRFPTRLHCQSYIPAQFRNNAQILVHTLLEGQGLLIPPLVPHSVAASGTATLAYAAYVNIPRINTTQDIGDLATA